MHKKMADMEAQYWQEKNRFWCVIKGIGLNHNAFIYLSQLVNTIEHTLAFYYIRIEYPQGGGNCGRISTEGGGYPFSLNRMI